LVVGVTYTFHLINVNEQISLHLKFVESRGRWEKFLVLLPTDCHCCLWNAVFTQNTNHPTRVAVHVMQRYTTLCAIP